MLYDWNQSFVSFGWHSAARNNFSNHPVSESHFGCCAIPATQINVSSEHTLSLWTASKHVCRSRWLWLAMLWTRSRNQNGVTSVPCYGMLSFFCTLSLWYIKFLRSTSILVFFPSKHVNCLYPTLCPPIDLIYYLSPSRNRILEFLPIVLMAVLF